MITCDNYLAPGFCTEIEVDPKRQMTYDEILTWWIFRNMIYKKPEPENDAYLLRYIVHLSLNSCLITLQNCALSVYDLVLY